MLRFDVALQALKGRLRGAKPAETRSRQTKALGTLIAFPLRQSPSKPNSAASTRGKKVRTG